MIYFFALLNNKKIYISYIIVKYFHGCHVFNNNKSLLLYRKKYYMSFKKWSSAQDASSNNNKSDDKSKAAPAVGQPVIQPDKAPAEATPKS